MGIFDKIRSIEKLNEDALKYIDKTDCSWHDTYRNSSYIYIGNLDAKVTEGDIIVMFSQFGEPIDINLVRDEETGESKGYCFLAYADQRSTVLAVDNFIGYKLLDRPLVVDHVLNYRLPKKYTNSENIGTKEEYKPSGAEGGGIGVYNILGKKQNSKEDGSHDNTEETEASDEEELRTLSFEKFLKRKKEKENEKENENEKKKDKNRDTYKNKDKDKYKNKERDRITDKDKYKNKERDRDIIIDKDKYKNKERDRDRIKDKDSDEDRHRHRNKKRIKEKKRKREREWEWEKEKEKERKREWERSGERRKMIQEKEKIKKRLKSEGSGEIREQNESEMEKRKEKMKERERYEHKRDVLKNKHNTERAHYTYNRNSEEKSTLKGDKRKDKYKNKYREKYRESDEEKSRKHSFSNKYQDKLHTKQKHDYDETYHKRKGSDLNSENNYYR